MSLNTGGRWGLFSVQPQVLSLTGLPDSQTLRLDESMDSMGDDDPFTAKLSFEVRVPL